MFLFVAIPLPGTGAWTGALIADLLDIRIKHSLPVIAIGVFVAGIIVSVFVASLSPKIVEKQIEKINSEEDDFK